MRVTVLGAGAMGTACACLLARKGTHSVVLWCRREELAAELSQRRENRVYLPGIQLPETIQITADPHAVADAELYVVAIPCVHLRTGLAPLAEPMRTNDAPAVSVIKGLERETFLRPSEIIRQVTGAREVAVLSGPSHAEEFSRDLPTTVVVACSNERLAREIQQAFATPRFRVYTNPDVVGVELAGALKNVIGIAAGVCDGLRFGDNAKASLLTRGLVEITRFGTALGGQRETFWGLAGLGDLITTCVSPYGRNRSVGEALGRGERLSDILDRMKAVPEGVWTCKTVHDIARQKGLEMPITEQVYRVLYEGADPMAAVDALMTRELKAEHSPQ